MGKTVLVLSLLFSVMALKAQSFEWVAINDGTDGGNSRSIKVDNSGNVYTTGYFNGTMDFDPGSSTASFTTIGNADVYLQKINADGDLVWVKVFGGSSFDMGNSIAFDSQGNVYSIGFFSGTADFDPGPEIFNLTAVGYSDTYILKLDQNGNFIWAKSFGGQGYGIAINSLGYIFTTGSFWETVDFNPGGGINNLTSVGLSDLFIQKLDQNGNFLWAKSIGSTGTEAGLSIAVDDFGNVITSGHFQGTVDFNPGAGIQNLTSLNTENSFVLKLNQNGNFLWANAISGDINSMVLDDVGNVLTTGSFFGTVDFDPGVDIYHLTSTSVIQDAFIQKVNSDGEFLWAKSFGGVQFDFGKSISVDALGNVYSVGSFKGTVDFDPGPNTMNLTSIGEIDIYLQNLDSDGNFIRVVSYGGFGSIDPQSMTVAETGDIYTTGIFNGPVDFDPGINNTNNYCDNNPDIFVQKLNQTNTTSVIDTVGKRLFLAFPNPSDGNVSINFEQPLFEAQLQVITIYGEIVFQKTLNNESIANVKLGDASGVYYLRIKSEEVESTVKLIRQ